MDIRELGALQLDGLREVATVGAGHAATALSQLTSRRIMVRVPRMRMVTLEEVPGLVGDPDEKIAAVALQMLGDLTGHALQIFPGRTASRIAAILLGHDVVFPSGFGEIERSALMEVGNIVTGAYLNALSDFLGMLLLTSVPGLAIDAAGTVLTSGDFDLGAQVEEVVLCIDTDFFMGEDSEQLTGHFVLVPDPISLQVILKALRLA